ncbi:hypothetical protein B0681_08350 [Moraxella porci DSM 25326]|uniref:Uncharacterized protein n=1 Tax=Moraxella porci DSM 25326 TaxID=573983 RepID=A0A1T0CPK1_9GAMM|nr:hypothetical protein B0681_08350 [Moraxella porci DSM 25326]
MDNELKICDECGSSYFAKSSIMQSLCPECGFILYNHPKCNHVFHHGKCIKCAWNGNKSQFIKNLPPNSQDDYS